MADKVEQCPNCEAERKRRVEAAEAWVEQLGGDLKAAQMDYANEHRLREAAEANCRNLESALEEARKEARMQEERAKEAELERDNLADYARRGYDGWDMYRNAWLREMGGVIRCKWHQIDGFVLRMQDIYEKAKLVDRIKQIMVKEVKRDGATKDTLFDEVFKYLAESEKDQVPTN